MNYTLFLSAFLQKYQGINDMQMLFQFLREELQYLILDVIYSKTNFPLYFMGGTKLRLTHRINRFSEDLDFTLVKPDPNFQLENFQRSLEKAFTEKITGFHMLAKVSSKSNVVKVILSFSKLLFDLKLSPLKDQTLKIKIVIDTNPPQAAKYETTTYRSFAGDYLVHSHDLPTGFAGKIAAILNREYQKGRDYYDLQWYLQQSPKIQLNLEYLNANQTQQTAATLQDESAVIEMLKLKLDKLDKGLLKKDLERFITMDTEHFQHWIENYIPETLTLLSSYQNQHEA